MIKAIALDDEPLPLQLLKYFSAQVDFIDLVACFTSPTEAEKFVHKNEINLIFLDIQMPDISGLDFYKLLPNHVMVIFTSAYSEYAIEGFNIKAIDYLLKPFEFDRFLIATKRAEEYWNYQNNKSIQEKAIFLKADYSVVKVVLNEILYIEGLNNYLKIHLQDKKPLMVRMTMKEISLKLPIKEFMRVHRSYIIPLAKVQYVRNRVIFLDYCEIPVGINYVKQIQETFGSHS